MKYEVESRPWGMYEVLLDSPECKVKRISVAPESRLSYQYHFKRQEQWIVTKGILTIILDGEKVFRELGESIKIPKGAKHRAWNETDELVQFIEVQTGEYFGEDDIVRVEDDYNRE
jgi:mannose-6-phosphate isomerase